MFRGPTSPVSEVIQTNYKMYRPVLLKFYRNSANNKKQKNQRSITINPESNCNPTNTNLCYCKFAGDFMHALYSDY